MSDVWAALLWWGVVTAGGAAVWPLAVRLCPFGGGLTVAKALFPALTALLLVWFSTLRLLPFTALVVWLLLALLAAVNWLIPAWRRAALKELCRQRRTLLAFELFGLCLFAFGVYARGHLPGLDSLEKMMNVGFLNSLSRTDYLPAADMWFAGGSINYYYGGHLAVSVWQKLSGLGTPVAYNLAMATVFALVGSLAFQFGHALLGRPFTSERHRFLPVAAVLFYAAAAALAGWLHVLAPSRLTLAGAGTAFVFAVSHLLALPFNLHFEPIGKTLRLTEQHTGLYPFLVLWGLMLLLVLIVLVTYRSVSRQPTVTLLLILAACGVVFLLVPEFVYVVDIYGGDFKRANTMFKFTYQAFVLLMLVIGSGPALLLATRRRRAVAAAVLVGLLSLTFLWFPYRASGQWLGPLTPGRYRGIDGVAPLRSKTSPQLPAAGDGKLSDYFALIDWLNKEVAGQPVVLEAFGPSYTDHCLVSAFTGLPTVLGWETHEWLWRTTATAPHAYQTEIAPRQQAIQDFYAGGQLIRMRDFIDRFNVAYVVIGPFETDRFGCSPADPIWAEIGDVAFVSGDVTLLKVFR